MKKNIVFLCGFLLLCSCSPKEKEQKKAIPMLSYTSEINLDTVKNNTEVKRNIIIRNTGTANVVIKDIEASCDCTVIDKWDSIIEVGDSSSISVIFSPKHKGVFEKDIVIRSNIESEFSVITLKGYVKN